MPTDDRVHLTHENKKTSKNRILRPRSDNIGRMGIPAGISLPVHKATDSNRRSDGGYTAVTNSYGLPARTASASDDNR
jgi:hypothetical protein